MNDLKPELKKIPFNQRLELKGVMNDLKPELKRIPFNQRLELRMVLNYLKLELKRIPFHQGLELKGGKAAMTKNLENAVAVEIVLVVRNPSAKSVYHV